MKHLFFVAVLADLGFGGCKSLAPILAPAAVFAEASKPDTVRTVEVRERVDSIETFVLRMDTVECPASDTATSVVTIYKDRVKTKVVWRDSIFTIKVYEKVIDPDLTAVLAAEKAIDLIASGKGGIGWHWAISLLLLVAFLVAWNFSLRKKLSKWQNQEKP